MIRLFKFTAFALALLTLGPPLSAAQVDLNNDGLGDLWQLRFGAQGLVANDDADGDGLSNAVESLLGTDPFSARSGLAMEITGFSASALGAQWLGIVSKRYTVETSSNLTTWTPFETKLGNDATLTTSAPSAGATNFFLRVAVTDTDTDGDGLSDWEEIAAGFNSKRVFSEGLGSNPTTPTTNNPRITDLERFRTQIAATTNTVSIAAIDADVAESWPHPAVAVVRRAGRLDAITVNFTLAGTATGGVDYSLPTTTSVTIPAGVDEAVITLPILNDALTEGAETITVQLITGSGYVLAASGTAVTFTIADAAAGISHLEAARFLAQSTFGSTPTELARVRALGLAGWIDEQFNRPVALHLPIVQQWYAELSDGTPINNGAVNVEHRMEAWWRQTMRDDATSDPLRQRVAFALSQIFVISDRMSSLGDDQRGMTDYQDLLLRNAFGTYRQLLDDVTRHPWMGLYLSAMRNRKAAPAINRYPDENYAREVLQLFSIGLWRLNADGTHYLSNGTDLDPEGNLVPAGQSIPTYGQTQVSAFARVFTGLSFSTRFTSGTVGTEIATTRFYDSFNVPWRPMRMFDAEHDVATKTIWLPGALPLVLPTRTASTGSTAGDADLAATLDYIANHPNIGPFICRQLIQRLVTSNPTPDYVARISAVFANNGSGVRGDLRAVIRALLLDPEARDFASAADPEHGSLREPYTRYVAAARALAVAPSDVVSAGGRFRGFGSLDSELLQRPLSAPSVFNFYSPTYAPPGPVRDAGLVAPEFQALNSVTAISLPNRFSGSLSATSGTAAATRFNLTNIADDAATTPVNESLWNSRVNEAVWLELARGNPDLLVNALARTVATRPLSAATFRLVTRALRRLDDPLAVSTTLTAAQREQRALLRLRVAIHLLLIAPECAVLR
ncbi:DUF1800 family protein [Oleiharenicola lentus]|uniref:DUF1800 family protein n=1 Tax=Oleiharenicola lentus TaxID=2508720 RepID=UPI003F663D61